MRCEECEAAADAQARGWRAFLASGDDEDDAVAEVVMLCPACAEREFGERVRR